MKSVSRGLLTVVGLGVGFLTLVFLFQLDRYLAPAVAGGLLPLGMAGIYAVLTYTGAVVTILAFKPSVTIAKYLGGVSAGLTGLFLILSLYLFTIDLASGMMLLTITGGQVIVAGIVYGVAASREDDTTSSTDSEPSTSSDSDPTDGTTDTEPEDTSKSYEHPESHSESGTGWNVDWRTGGQIFAGAVLILVGAPITVASPLGVPILLLGLAFIPRVRHWSMRTLGRSNTE